MEIAFDSADGIGSNSFVSAHLCRKLRTNAPWDTMPHDLWLGCDPARLMGQRDV